MTSEEKNSDYKFNEESSESMSKTISTTEIIFICDICGERFQNKTAILSHSKWKHENINCSYKCNVCQKTFIRKYHLKRHEKNFFSSSTQKESCKNLIYCFFCNFSAPTKIKVLHHYEASHKINTSKKTLNFNTIEEFNNWKENFEKYTKSHFIKATRTQHSVRRGADVTKYICHRDGCFRSKSKGARHIKLVGSNKINAYCPANIVVHAREHNIIVNYMDTHIGHSLDISHLNISVSEKSAIAQKIALKIPFEQILDEIRDSIVNNVLERIHLITRKDLWNIADTYNLNHEAILNKNDFLSVEAWVSHMKKSSNLVRFYKPQGVLLEDFPKLKKDDFVLIIMNDAQLEILQKFGNDCVCIDGTHGLNAYDFQLYTVMVLDDARQSFPCSFLFSNRGDTVAMELYFRTIKDCLHELHDTLIKPKTFMSDMDDTFYNAWYVVMGPVENRLFCSWHVDRAWRKNLNKIRSKEKQAIVYKKIKIIMYEMDLETFNVMIANLLTELRADPECLDFFSYFEIYAKKCRTWAYCYRKHCGINTNMNLENMHKILKHLYFGGKKVKRVDKGITVLMKFIRDKLFDRLVILHKGKVSKKLASIRKIHKNSVGLNNTITEEGDFWNVLATKCNDIYKVEATKTTCTCSLRCQDCEVCIHAYTCSCINFSIKWNMCKHIHLVCMFLKSKASTEVNVTDNVPPKVACVEMNNFINSSSDVPEESAILSVVSTVKSDHKTFHRRKQDKLNKFLQVYNTIENEEQLEAVSKQLAPLESIINALSKKEIFIPKTSKEPPNKKIKSQTRFFSTKRRNKAKQNKFVNPSNSEKPFLALQMVQQNNL